MENNTSINHENGNDANRLLAAVVEPLIKCTRCRHKHTLNDRVKVRRAKSAWFDMVCPKCNGKSYTDLRAQNTCYAFGLI